MVTFLLLLLVLSIVQFSLCQSGTDELKAHVRELLAAIDKEVSKFSKLKDSCLDIQKNCEKKISKLRYEEIEELTRNNDLYWEIDYLKKKTKRTMKSKLHEIYLELLKPQVERKLKKVDFVQELMKPEKASEIENWKEFLRTECIEMDRVLVVPDDVRGWNRSLSRSVVLDDPVIQLTWSKRLAAEFNDSNTRRVWIRKINHAESELQDAEEVNALQKTLNRELKQECRDRIETLDHDINELIIGIIEPKLTRSKYNKEDNLIRDKYSHLSKRVIDIIWEVKEKREKFVDFCKASNAL